MSLTNFSKKPAKASVKAFNLNCILKFSKGEIVDKAFLVSLLRLKPCTALNVKFLQDGVMDHLFELLVDTFSLYSHTIGFPELVVPPVAQVS